MNLQCLSSQQQKLDWGQQPPAESWKKCQEKVKQKMRIWEKLQGRFKIESVI